MRLLYGTRMMSTAAALSKRLSGRTAIVTGSTYGIGFAIARRMAQEGANVMVSSRKSENVEKAVHQLQSEGLDVRGVKCHVGDPKQRTNLITETVKTFGQLDILVLNASVNPHVGEMLEISEQQWDKIFDVNVKSSFFLLKDAVPHLERNGGSITFITSVSAYVPYELIGAYSVSKAAQIGMVKSLVVACSKKNIRVNAVAAGLIKTSFSKVMWNNKSVAESYLNSIPSGRFGLPEEIATVTAFLASDEASYILGETIVVGGGITSRF